MIAPAVAAEVVNAVEFLPQSAGTVEAPAFGRRQYADGQAGNAPTWVTPDGARRALAFATNVWELTAVADDDVPTPAIGKIAFYYSLDQGVPVIKNSDGDVFAIMATP
jgi:hypothetical protein